MRRALARAFCFVMAFEKALNLGRLEQPDKEGLSGTLNSPINGFQLALQGNHVYKQHQKRTHLVAIQGLRPPLFKEHGSLGRRARKTCFPQVFPDDSPMSPERFPNGSPILLKDCPNVPIIFPQWFPNCSMICSIFHCFPNVFLMVSCVSPTFSQRFPNVSPRSQCLPTCSMFSLCFPNVSPSVLQCFPNVSPMFSQLLPNMLKLTFSLVFSMFLQGFPTHAPPPRGLGTFVVVALVAGVIQRARNLERA